MSYDGNYMWINNADVPNRTAVVHRVSMDGLVDEDHSSEFVGLSHQLTVLPDETVAFYAYGTNGCDDIKLRAPDGTVTTVVNARAAHGGTVACHVNAIFYSSSRRHADLLGPRQQLPHQDHAERSDRLGLEQRRRGDELVQRRQLHLARGRARVPHPGARRLRHLQQQQRQARREHHRVVGRRRRRRDRVATRSR